MEDPSRLSAPAEPSRLAVAYPSSWRILNPPPTWSANTLTTDVGPTLEAMQKMIAFYHDKNIDMLKLGCTLSNLTNFCLHKSTDPKIYPFTEGDKDLLEKKREDVVGSPSIVFKRNAVVDETFIRKSTKICKSFVGSDASQLYPYSMCQLMSTGLYTRWDFDS